MCNPLIQDTIQSYRQLAHQMGRISDFFGVPPALIMPPLVNKVLVEQPPPEMVERNQAQNGPEIVMVPINQDDDQVLRNVQQDNFVGAEKYNKHGRTDFGPKWSQHRPS